MDRLVAMARVVATVLRTIKFDDVMARIGVGGFLAFMQAERARWERLKRLYELPESDLAL